MVRSALGKLAWVGRATVFLVGLAVVLALVFGVATMAFATNGDNLVLGVLNNAATKVTRLVGNVDGPALQVQNTNAGTNDTALDLRVQPGEAPMRVNSDRRVADLNADKLDGRDFSAFGAQQVIDKTGPLPVEGTFTSRGGTLIVSVSGSGYRGTGSSQLEGLIAMEVRVDGGDPHFLRVYTNERNSHKAFISREVVFEGFPAGQHTVSLGRVYAASVCNTAIETKDAPCTATDANDYFHATVTEIPD